MNSRSKYRNNGKARRTGWPETYRARQLEGFLGANGCATSQIDKFDDLHLLAKAAFGINNEEADYEITSAQIDALGKKERRTRVIEYVKATCPLSSALWPALSRARGTLSGQDSKVTTAAKVIAGQRPSYPGAAFIWPHSLRFLRAWMVVMGFDPSASYTEAEILEVCWETHQSGFKETRAGVTRPTTLEELQRRLTGEGKKYHAWRRTLSPTREHNLGTFGPASTVRFVDEHNC